MFVLPIAGILRGVRAAAFALAVAVFSVAPAAGQPASSVLIFAAASLQTALDELSPAISKETGVTVRASYAATSALARQIERGAPAGIFISADQDWMNYVADRRLIDPASRVNLVGNALVLVAPAAAPVSLKIAPGFGLAAALGSGRLAVADPDSVPAGKYAKAALTALGVWGAVAKRIAPAQDVRAALFLVSRREAPLGVVYRSDAIAEPRVVIVDTFAATLHPPIVYPAALTTAASPAAARVLAYLRGPAAQKVFSRHGFTAGVN
jgi:molybdate transport system substrate-binding protein